MLGTLPLGKQILVIDDDTVSRLLLRRIIQRLGSSPLEAADGDEGWRLLQEHRPDIVFLDLHMPGRDGLQLIREIRADPVLFKLLIVVQSASALPHEVQAGLDAGANWYLTKPLHVDQITQLLVQALGD